MAKKQTLAPDARGSLTLAGTLVVVATMIGDATLGLLAGIAAFLLIVYAMFRMPMRYSMMMLMFFAVALPNPAEGMPTSWAPPFSMTGQALMNHLNTIDRSGILGLFPVSCMEMFFAILGVIYYQRKTARSKLDGEIVPTPKPLIQLALVSLGATVFTWSKGLAFGGDFAMSLWQVNAVLYLPIVFLLMQASLRGPEDIWPLARVFLAAGVYKSFLATYVVQTIKVPADAITGSTQPAFGTTHNDSMLFAVCVVILVAPLLEKPEKKAKKLAFGILPIILMGIVSNNRRLAWVQIAIVMLIVYLVSRDTPAKRFVRRALVAMVPVAAIYIAAGWNSQNGRLFKPVRMIRSVVDAESDSSSQWREFENTNIILTFRDNPILGSGYGHPYKEVLPMPAVDYSLERWIPHNSLLGLWGFTGLVGFAGLTLLWVAGVYFAMRAYHAARAPMHRTASILCFAALPVYLVQSFGDLGLPSWTGIFLMGTGLSMAGKLAVVTGQWQAHAYRKRAPVQSAAAAHNR